LTPGREEIVRLRAALLRWYRRNARDLPWRRTSDPYAIWVAEVMLQQTQVATVEPYYRRFLERFPDPLSLSTAGEEEVLALWSGLGYYRRARALHAGSRVVVERHDGRLPADAHALRELPGVGRYTAGAISSIAFGLAEPVLDGNVRRVLARLFAIDGRRVGPRVEERTLWRIAEELARGPQPGDLNQALMELGALVCTPRAPDCPACPLWRRCRAKASGDPESLPAPKKTRSVEKVRVAVAAVSRSGRLLLERPADGSPLRGTWDLPAVEMGEYADAVPAIRETLRRRHGLQVRVRRALGSAVHGILHRRLRLEGLDCRLVRGRVAGRPGLRWIAPSALDGAAVSGATRKILGLLDGFSGE